MSILAVLFRGSSLLNLSVNSEYIVSLFKYGYSTYYPFPLFHGLMLNYNSDEPLHPCTIDTFYSTFIENIMGPLSTLNNSPIFCAFTFQRSANVTSISQIDFNIK